MLSHILKPHNDTAINRRGLSRLWWEEGRVDDLAAALEDAPRSGRIARKAYI